MFQTSAGAPAPAADARPDRAAVFLYALGEVVIVGNRRRVARTDRVHRSAAAAAEHGDHGVSGIAGISGISAGIAGVT